MNLTMMMKERNLKDSQCLPSLLQNTVDNLSEHELQVEEILADGNYSSK